MQDIGKTISPGQQISNVYYDHQATHLAKSKDDVLQNNRFTQSFNSLDFGTQSMSLLIPNDMLIGSVYVALRFQGIADSGGNRLGIVPLPAYAVIAQIEYQIGGSVVYQQNGLQAMYSALADACSKEQRDEMIRLAGGIGSFAGASYQTNNTYYAHIKLPWSNIAAANYKKNPIDSRLVNQPLRVNLYLRQANAIYYNLAGTVSTPTKLLEGYFQVIQYQFTDSSHHLKLKYDVVENGQIVQKNNYYAYPFTFIQDFSISPFTGVTVGNSPLQIPLTGFKSGNLMAIRLMLFDITGNGNPVASPCSSTTNILSCQEWLSVSLFFNGLEIFRSRYDSWKMNSIQNNSVQTNAQLTSSTDLQYWLEIPISQYLPELTSSSWQKGMNLSSQTLILQFNTQTTNTFIIQGSYLYHADIIMDGSNAEISFL